MDINEEDRINWDTHGLLLDKFFEIKRELNHSNEFNLILEVRLTKAMIMLRRASWHVINLQEVYNP